MMMTIPPRSAKTLLIQLGRAELLPLRSFRDETSLMEHIRRDWTLYELHDFSMTIEPPGFFCDYPADYPLPKSGMSIVTEGDRLHFVYATPDLKGKLKSIIADLLVEADKAKEELAALAKDGDGAPYDGHFYYDDYKMNTMSIDEIKRAVELVKRWDMSGNIAEVKDTMLKRGDLKKDQRYKVAKQRGSDGRKPLKKEITNRLGLSRPALDALLKKPDNEWGLTTDCIQSWPAFDYYCETHKNIIDQHKANPKSKIRKSRAKLVLTKTGDMGNQSQSATQNYKPHSRTIAKPKG